MVFFPFSLSTILFTTLMCRFYYDCLYKPLHFLMISYENYTREKLLNYLHDLIAWFAVLCCYSHILVYIHKYIWICVNMWDIHTFVYVFIWSWRSLYDFDMLIEQLWLFEHWQQGAKGHRKRKWWAMRETRWNKRYVNCYLIKFSIDDWWYESFLKKFSYSKRKKRT